MNYLELCPPIIVSESAFTCSVKLPLNMSSDSNTLLLLVELLNQFSVKIHRHQFSVEPHEMVLPVKIVNLELITLPEGEPLYLEGTIASKRSASLIECVVSRADSVPLARAKIQVATIAAGATHE